MVINSNLRSTVHFWSVLLTVILFVISSVYNSIYLCDVNLDLHTNKYSGK